jgi:hypothetical protein
MTSQGVPRNCTRAAQRLRGRGTGAVAAIARRLWMIAGAGSGTSAGGWSGASVDKSWADRESQARCDGADRPGSIGCSEATRFGGGTASGGGERLGDGDRFGRG